MNLRLRPFQFHNPAFKPPNLVAMTLERESVRPHRPQPLKFYRKDAASPGFTINRLKKQVHDSSAILHSFANGRVSLDYKLSAERISNLPRIDNCARAADSQLVFHRKKEGLISFATLQVRPGSGPKHRSLVRHKALP